MSREPDKLLDLTAKVIEARPPEEIKPLLSLVGRVLLAQKFEEINWIKDLKTKLDN